MRKPHLCITLYTLFLLWQNRWFAKPLSEAEVADYLNDMLPHEAKGGALSANERANFRAFLLADDGQPFYMVNLMQYRETAVYPDGTQPTVKTGREANILYSKAVVKELLKRGSYPVFLSHKLANFLSAGEGTDFFEEVGIVRYRSRRDLMAMTRSPAFLKAEPHKWASMEKTAVVPTHKILLLNPSVIVPALLLLGATISKFFERRNTSHV
jgi:hypothetical protein